MSTTKPTGCKYEPCRGLTHGFCDCNYTPAPPSAEYRSGWKDGWNNAMQASEPASEPAPLLHHERLKVWAAQDAASEPAPASAPQNWVVRKNGYFYRPNSRGYTSSILEAGRYTREEAEAHAAASSGEVTAHSASDFPAPAMAAAVDRAMVEMQNMHPPLRRSDCERLIRAALEAEPAPASAPRRWNIEEDGDDLLICFDLHDKGEKCEYVRYVRARAHPCQCGELREAAERVVKLRVGELPSKGWLPDNDATRLALHELASATAPRSGESK